jgi:hypothetical protein
MKKKTVCQDVKVISINDKLNEKKIEEEKKIYTSILKRIDHLLKK